MEHLLLHPNSKSNVAQFVAHPSHALLLVGSNGIGKMALAEAMVAAVLEVEPAKLHQHPYFTVVSPVKDNISIDAIRELQRFLQLRTLGDKPLRRAIIIEHAEGLTIEAQNAYLKLLEEPPADTIIILTVDNQRTLLPTILSRAQMIALSTPEESALKQHFAADPNITKDDAAINQAFFLSGGLPGLMHALLKNDGSHPLVQGVAIAKEILQKQTFERLALVEGLSKQKEEARYALDALQHIAQTGLAQAAKKEDPAKIKQWHSILKATSEASGALAKNANTKLVLDNLMLRI